MAEVSQDLLEAIVEAASRGFNPYHEQMFGLARDLLVARAMLRESKREHYHAQHVNEYKMRGCCPECSCGEAGTSGACTCGADAFNARIDAVLDGRKC